MPRRDPFDLVGTTLTGKYAVEAVVDEGGFSVVYRARHMVWNRPVAIKAFKTGEGAPTSDEQNAMLRGFIQEGAILAELSERSTAICQARDVSTLTTTKGEWVPFMVLEWLEGESLEAMLLREREAGVTPRAPEKAVRLLEPVAQALALAHDRGIVHRDVKPGNIFVLSERRGDTSNVKLLDFGIAKVGARDPRKTLFGPRSFTPSYGAPEQFWPTFGVTSAATDVFALALVMVELITGNEALVGDDVEDLARQSADTKVRPTPRARGARVSDEAEAVFLRALSIEPTARYANARAFWDALRAALELAPNDAGEPIEPDAPTERRPRSETPVGGVAVRMSAATLPSARPRRRLAWRAVAVTLLLAATGGFYVGYPRLARYRHRAVQSAALAPSPRLAPSLSPPPPPAPPGASPSPLPAPPLTPASPSAPASASASVSASASASAAASPADCPDGMLPIPESQFFMGTDDGPAETRPAHAVHVSTFCIDRFEVTTADYKTCSDHGACKRAGETNAWIDIGDPEHNLYDSLCNVREPKARGKHPINCVDWQMAAGYCAARGARLPSEAEWELAARGPDGRLYPWGDSPPTALLANACDRACVGWGLGHHALELQLVNGDDAFATTAPVGSFPAGRSPYGVEDTAGNVWEWVDDRWAAYDGSSASDDRVIRGGAWNSGAADWVSATYRFAAGEATRSYGIGFRCAR